MGLQGIAPQKDVWRIPAVYWPGESGNLHLHWVFSCWALPPFTVGHFNYMFVRREPDGQCTPLYIGETANFADCMRRHESWQDAISLGMNEVHVDLSADSIWVRQAIETDLLIGQRPELHSRRARLMDENVCDGTGRRSVSARSHGGHRSIK